ncbi:MAG: sugar ABC transporter substrate-binding protein [Corynebacterium sp.]|uniref:ABC transporter substrate-binding protein n=1 Tax=Corynebacterium sp. TaxID=1720 RepID=UPI0026DFDE0F|nr:sugar ABC transporter substrate-binding protein [Corynebacterium sp.]MDO5670098.1 sugar ABC transporter substrate-binding protein [Corynebacterium sp.]
MRKPLAAIAAALAAMTMMAGCGSAPATQAPTQNDGALEGEITFWHSFTQGPRLETIQAAADEFTADNPGVSIKIETFSWADFYTKWTTGLASGNVPDLSTALPNHVVEMLDAEAIVPMDDLIDEIGRDRFYEAPLKEVTSEGATYAVPLYSHAQVMWYRKDLLAKYNLEVPTTWDELKTAATTISQGEAGAAYGLSVPMGTNDMMATRWLNFYVRSAGERLLTDDNKANLASPAAIEGAKYWTDLYQTVSPKDSVNFNVLDQATLFYQGRTAFDFNSGFQIGGVQTNRPDLLDQIAAAPMPTLKKGDAATGYETSNIPLVVWENSEHPRDRQGLHQVPVRAQALRALPAVGARGHAAGAEGGRGGPDVPVGPDGGEVQQRTQGHLRRRGSRHRDRHGERPRPAGWSAGEPACDRERVPGHRHQRNCC